ncbi:MAG: C25 family cysteine peptidase [Methylococcales bacterium]|nr:C25 family cysteine peptidase [Methylococcales bacterium]
MPNLTSKIDLSKITQLRTFKINYQNVRNLDYVDNTNLKPQNFEQFKALIPPAAFVAEEQARPAFSADLKHLQSYSLGAFPKGKMLVLVNFDLYAAVKASINQYIQDLAYEGYFATAFKVKGGTPVDLRNFLKGKQPILGALMVGSLPVAWFEMADDFGGAAEFPCDLYFMDLNGTWNDPDGDGKFSEHPTNVAPEIWVGRLWTPSSNGNDAALINDYFNRNHLYRKGLFGASNKALAFVDDDWAGFGDCALDSMFPAANIETITDPTTTDGDRYKAEVQQFRAWAHICAHSSPGGHSFKVPGAASEWIPNTYLRDVNPPNAYFYNLFACSNALFTQADYMAGWYIFDKAGGSTCNGLAAVGSAKTGSMLAFENFYTPMGNGKVIGDAYVDWWKALGAAHDLGMRQWYYGMALLGDPTLNWWTGVVPTLRNPHNNDTFDHYPRLITFQWDPVTIAGATYNVEVDAFRGKWSAETNTTWLISGALIDTSYEHLFVGAQRGRWRVRANVNGRVCPWSEWRYFTFTV